MTPNFTPTSKGQPMVPVTIAAVGPAMLWLAGELCDGVRLHGFCTRRYLDEVVLAELRTGWAKSGRPRAHFEISGGGFIATGPDDATVAKMFEWVRTRVAFYGSTPGYWPVLEVHGLHDLGRKLNVMSKTGQWDKMSAEISDDVVRLFAAVGTHRELARSSAGSPASPTRSRPPAATASTRTPRPISSRTSAASPARSRAFRRSGKPWRRPAPPPPRTKPVAACAYCWRALGKPIGD